MSEQAERQITELLRCTCGRCVREQINPPKGKFGSSILRWRDTANEPQIPTGSFPAGLRRCPDCSDMLLSSHPYIIPFPRQFVATCVVNSIGSEGESCGKTTETAVFPVGATLAEVHRWWQDIRGTGYEAYREPPVITEAQYPAAGEIAAPAPEGDD